MKRRSYKLWAEIFQPKLSRRQRLAMDCFKELNREREFIASSMGAKPLNIKRREIVAYHADMVEPIALEYLVTLVQACDDAFITFSAEQIKNYGKASN